MIFQKDGNALIAARNGETLRIEGWGKDALRVRAVRYDAWSGENRALTETPDSTDCDIRIGEEKHISGDTAGQILPCAEIRNGRIRATVNFAGVVSFYRDDRLILREYYRFYGGTLVKTSRCLKLKNREIMSSG